MAENQKKVRRKIFKMNKIDPIIWEPYKGETVIVNTIIRKGEKIFEKKFYEDRVKAEPKGNAYIIGNGPSRQNFDLNKLTAFSFINSVIKLMVAMPYIEISCLILFSVLIPK